MPTYDYQCEACGHKEEIFQKMSEDAIRTCTKCKKKKFLRLIGTGGGILFKGSGFYQTDYRNSSYSTDAKNDTESCSGNPKACDGPCSTGSDS
ncbi:MAG TPA: zinc ribbon domain-containing protein [Planctomycetota bacterium]|nr:zinc ribbon domain-containing protein [Planctomycetota bacterium]